MRKIHLLALGLAFLLGCTKESDIDLHQYSELRGFTASIESSVTRVHAEGLSIKWDNGDEVCVFDGTNQMLCTYNSNENFFQMPGEMPEWVSYVYAVYPSSSANGMENGKIKVSLPSEQSYSYNSFGQGANTMVAQITGENILFKNLGAYLKLYLYGNNVDVKSISLRGNNGEQLNGTALVHLDEDGVPRYKWGTQGGDVITIVCPEQGVRIGSNVGEATPFWIVVPPQEFAKGITVTVVDKNGKEFVKSTSNPISLDRNYIQPMAAFEYLAPLEIICSAGEMKVSLPINGDSKSISVENFLPINIDLETLTPSGENLPWREMIEKIEIPNGIVSIDDGAFAFCTNLERVTIPESVDTIGFGAFAKCESLTQVTIPAGVKTIGNMAFALSGLTTVSIPSTVERLGMGVFAGTKLTDVDIPDSVTGSLKSTFQGCTSLENVTLSENLVELGNYAFSGCTSLESIVIPANVEEIEEVVFEGCTNLKSVVFEENSKLRFIWYSSFLNCINLESITLPASLGGNSEVYDEDFVNDSYQADQGIGIPVLGTSRGLGQNVFTGCDKLTTVYSLSENPLALDYNSDDTYPFPFNNDGFKVYVPSESARSAYAGNQDWGLKMGVGKILVKPSVVEP